MAPQSSDTKLFNDIQQGRLIQQVETLANNVEKHAEAVKDIRDRVTALESEEPVITHDSLSELYERLTVLETNHTDKETISDIKNRITIIETKRMTMTEILGLLMSIAAIAISILQLFAK